MAGDLAWNAPAPPPATATSPARPAAGTSGTALVAAIQGNVPHARNLPNLLRATTVTANHAAATQWLASQVRAGREPAPQLVIWPENSTDIDPTYSPPTYSLIAGAVTAINRPVLVGAVLDYPRRNAGQLWLPGRGPVQVYLKRQLVPFGEVIPFRSFLLHFTSLPNLQPINFTPGHKAVVFHVGQIRLGDVICYEIGFDNLVRSEVLAGANLLAVQTNDATFEVNGQLGESLQQLAMTRMQAITTGRAIVVASTTGVSSFVEPDGSVALHSGTWQRAVLEARVPLETALTPADRLGQWPELALIAGTLLAFAWSLLRSLTRYRSTRPAA
jgi:apolipoprotein N-acyltransferase